jgi:excisionase family DNA binding protein
VVSTAKEIEDRTNIHASAWYRWAATEQVPHYKVGRRYIRFRLSEILEWLSRQKVHEKV